MARRKSRRKKVLRLTAVLLSLSIVLVVSIYAVRVTKILGSDLVYENIYVNDELVSGMTYNELEEYLYNNYQNSLEQISFSVKVKDKTYNASLKDFAVKYDISSTVEKIYTVGREGSVLEKLAVISKTKDEPVIVHFDYTYNEALIDEFVLGIYNAAYIEKNPSYYRIMLDDKKVELTGGNRGESIDIDILKDAIKEIVETAKKDVSIEVPVIYDDLEEIKGEEIFNKVYIQARDASSDIIGKDLRIIPHRDGQEVDIDQLKEAVDYVNSNENSFRELEIYAVSPEKTVEVYEKNLFTSTLGTASTQFYTSTDNGKARAVNIKLATDIINGTLIAPGQTFSFNGVVGPRSADRGYQVAHVYESGEVVDGIGGGICQVSSTLYNSVLYADLEIADRRSHMFIVPYVPLGTDATVDYGSQDFKFVNNTEYPIRVEGFVSEDNKVHFKIVGTDPDPSVSVKIKSVTLEEIPYEVVYVDDPNLAEGTKIVKNEGMNGYVAEAFKVYYKNGSFLKEVSLGISRYRKYDEVIRVGTK